MDHRLVSHAPGVQKGKQSVPTIQNMNLRAERGEGTCVLAADYAGASASQFMMTIDHRHSLPECGRGGWRKPFRRGTADDDEIKFFWVFRHRHHIFLNGLPAQFVLVRSRIS
jgi:hypothetical protein